MPERRKPIIVLLAAAAALAGCESSDGDRPADADQPLEMESTCDEWTNSSSTRRDHWLRELVRDEAVYYERPAGATTAKLDEESVGKAADAFITELCERNGPSFVPADAAFKEAIKFVYTPDEPDPEPTTTPSPTETVAPVPQCRNGVDDDKDGLTDFPAEEYNGCYYADDPTEY